MGERERMKLSKEKIIKSKSDFNLVCQEGKAYADKYMVMYVFYAASDADKVGFAAGKRLGAAPVRNRIKRIMRESYRLNCDKLKSGGIWLVLVGRMSAAKVKRQTIDASFLSLAAKAGILKL